MPTLIFAPKFVVAVASGAKLQTIRDSRRCKPGDLLSLRAWSGAAYRSKQWVIREGVCTTVEPIAIDSWSWLGGPLRIEVSGINVVDVDAFARADGFDGHDDMMRWYESTRALPYEGWIHKWKMI